MSLRLPVTTAAPTGVSPAVNTAVPTARSGLPARAAGRRGRRRRHTAGIFILCMVLTAALSSLGTAAWIDSRGTLLSGGDHWRRVFREDFGTDVGLGQFPGSVYGSRFSVYPDGWADTSGRGRYAPSTVLSVQDGSLTWDMHAVDGVPQGAAVLPTLPTYGQTYGRYSVRFRADPVPGYGLAFLLWPDSERWPRDGEIDFPEGRLAGHLTAVAHHASDAGGTDPFILDATFGSWHVATIEWAPDRITFVLDGAVVGTSVSFVPARSMHWVLQTGSENEALPAPGARARIQVDWLEADARG